MKTPVLLVALLAITAAFAAPTVAAGPCDNWLEEIACEAIAAAEGAVQAVKDSVRHLCDHWQICLGDAYA